MIDISSAGEALVYWTSREANSLTRYIHARRFWIFLGYVKTFEEDFNRKIGWYLDGVLDVWIFLKRQSVVRDLFFLEILVP